MLQSNRTENGALRQPTNVGTPPTYVRMTGTIVGLSASAATSRIVDGRSAGDERSLAVPDFPLSSYLRSRFRPRLHEQRICGFVTYGRENFSERNYNVRTSKGRGEIHG